MRLVLLYLAVSLAASMPFEKTDDTIEVEVREIRVEDEGLRTKRGAKMSMKKMFEFDLNNETVTLDLTLNELVNDNAPMYVSENGNFSKWERQNTDEQYAFYQDQNTMASILVRCKADLCKPLGTFSVKGKKYSLDLNGKPIESKSLVSPVADPPNMIVSREGDMVILKIDPSNNVVQKQTEVSTSSPSQPEQQSSRKKRAIPTGTDIVEIMVYTDEVICSRFIALNNGDRSAGLEAIRFYYTLLINEMDTVYQPFHNHPSNTAGIDIRLFFSGIVVSCGSKTATWSSSRHRSSTDLSFFASWQGRQKRKFNFKYDIAMGISGLGASHDQDVGCPLGYIMSAYATTATLATATTQYQFSTCSVGEIQSTVSGLGSTRCTLNYNFNDAAYDEFRAGAIGGDVLSLNYQCQVYFGSGSSACLTNSSTMCYSGVYCQSSTGCNGRLHLVKEYTECDTNKWCVKGECVDKTTSATNAPGKCLVYKRCVKQNKIPVGDGCCQGSITTNCCVLGRRQHSCYVVAPCA